MATLRQLPDEVLREVAAQVSDFMPNEQAAIFGAGAPPSAQLREYFPVVTIPMNRMDELRKDPPPAGSSVDLSRFVVETGLWHYQIAKGGVESGYAHAQVDRSGHHVQGVSITSEARRISNAIVAADSLKIPDTYEAVLIDLPQIAVAGISLIDRTHKGESYINVFRRPDDPRGLQISAVQRASEFLVWIVTLANIEGVRF